MAGIVRNWVGGRASALDGLMNHEERNKESWATLADAKAGEPLLGPCGSHSAMCIRRHDWT